MEFGSYVSCIKIKGVPILPPLITSERRKELQAYRNQALSLEDLYNNRKLTRKKDEESTKNIKPTNEIHCHESNLDQELKNIVNPLKYVPYECDKKVLNLSKELVYVSEYSSATGISKCSIGSEIETTTSGVELETDEESRKNSEASSDEITEMQKPRLIRSNSYTLENPSPLLLAHLERQKSDSSSSDNTVTDSHLLENERISSDMLNFFMENNELSHEVNKVEDSNDINESILVHSSIGDDHQKTQNNPPIVEVVTTDITVQQINITTSIDKKIEEKDMIEIMNNNDSKPEAVTDLNKNTDTDPMNELKLVLQQIPEMYSKKIVELIEKQNQEQSKRIENYETLKQLLLQSGDGENNKVEVVTPTKIFVQQTVPVNMPLGRIETSEEESKNSVSNGNQSLIFDMSLSTSCTESLDDDSLRTIRIPAPMNAPKNSKEIKISERRAKEEKAASIICAYARGYLVRRLMKTAKVIQLIQTIQEALICALEMRASDTLEEADIELHRRLIQQISAACYEFHDVFFALTIPEQMDLIAVDREQKKRALKIKTIRSAPDFNPKKRQGSGVRLTKSLTNM